MLRKKGHNAHNVLFVGSDLANLLIYKKMVDDMSNGYRVLGYFANHEIPDCPKDLKYLGTRDRLDKIMNLDMDFTASGENMKVDEVYCSISHTDSDYILKLMRFCNMNVIRFHYVPASLVPPVCHSSLAKCLTPRYSCPAQNPWPIGRTDW